MYKVAILRMRVQETTSFGEFRGGTRVQIWQLNEKVSVKSEKLETDKIKV